MKFSKKDKVLVYANDHDVRYETFIGVCLENADNETNELIDVVNLETREILSVYSHSLRLPDGF